VKRTLQQALLWGALLATPAWAGETQELIYWDSAVTVLNALPIDKPVVTFPRFFVFQPVALMLPVFPGAGR
jgi:hypothetical protein